MNILFYRYGSICEPDFLDGFRLLGNSVTELTYEIKEKKVDYSTITKLVSEELLKKSYDFVFSINFYPFLAEICNIHEIRYISQTVDSPVIELYSDSIKRKWNRIFLFCSEQYSTFHPLNKKNIFYLPLAGNPNRLSTISSTTTRDFSNDVSFVGSLYTEKCPYDSLSLDEYTRGFLLGLMMAQSKIYGYHFISTLLKDSMVQDIFSLNSGCKEEYPIPPKELLVRKYIDAKITSLNRISLLSSISKHFNLGLYTGSDTGSLPIRSKGLVKSLTEMPLVFNNSLINLNFTAKSIRSGIPLRIFDVLASQGFLITNYQEDLEKHFDLQGDLETFTSTDELLSKIDYYLRHPKDRLEIATNGYNKVKKYHNYPERILNMIELAYKER